jgi:hypothetical protein
MAILSEKTKIAYFDVPKIACTSLKTMFWEISNNRAFSLTKGKPPLSKKVLAKLGIIEKINRLPIHDIDGYRTRSFKMVGEIPDGYETMAVVRDPAARLHSAWRNRVGKHVLDRPNTREDLFNEGLPFDPDFGFFIDNFEGYCAAARLARIHTLPYSWHLGPDIKFFDHVFKIEELDRLVEYVSGRLNRRVDLPHDNAAENDKRSNKITDAQAEKMRNILAADYDWLGGIYSFEAGVARYLR